VSGTLGEVPDIAIVERFNLISPLLIHGREKNRSIVDDSPFGDSMPVKFAEGSLLEMLLGTGDL
jgi:hypothetical protein